MKFNQRTNRWELYYVPQSPQWKQMFTWCWQTFGHPGTDPDSGVKSDWDYHSGYIYFYDEKCVVLYSLRWK